MCLFVSNSLLFVMFVTEETPVSFTKLVKSAPKVYVHRHSFKITYCRKIGTKKVGAMEESDAFCTKASSGKKNSVGPLLETFFKHQEI